MGMMKWIARKGNVGGTARWAANGYKVFISEDPNMELSELFKVLIKHRYAVIPNSEQENRLLIITGQPMGLRDLVASILTVEAGFSEISPEYQQMYMQIIDEELEKANIPSNVIYG